MRLWLVTHRAGDEPPAEDHCVTDTLEDAIDEIRAVWSSKVAHELGMQAVGKLIEARDAEAKDQPRPAVVARMIIPDDTAGPHTGVHAIVELRAFDTNERMWFGCLTQHDA